MTIDPARRKSERPVACETGRAACVAALLRVFPIRRVGRAWIAASVAPMLALWLWIVVRQVDAYAMFQGDWLALMRPPNFLMKVLVLEGVLVLISLFYSLVMLLTYYRAWRSVFPLNRIETAHADKPPPPSRATVLMLVPLVNLVWMFPGYLKLVAFGRLTAQITGEAYAGPTRFNVWCYLVAVVLSLLAGIMLMLETPLHPLTRQWMSKNELLLMAGFSLSCVVLLVIHLRLALRLDAMTVSSRRGWERLIEQKGGRQP